MSAWTVDEFDGETFAIFIGCEPVFYFDEKYEETARFIVECVADARDNRAPVERAKEELIDHLVDLTRCWRAGDTDVHAENQ